MSTKHSGLFAVTASSFIGMLLLYLRFQLHRGLTLSVSISFMYGLFILSPIAAFPPPLRKMFAR
jgi:hypothetical protein